MTTRIWLVTGEPAVGKSTAISKILFELRKAGFAPGGVLTREIRSHGEREGFLLIDIASDRSRVLADTKGITGPRIGKYRVDLNSLSTLGVEAIKHAALQSDVIAVDEIGPMELLSPEFRRAVRSGVLEIAKKPALCAVHKRFQDPLIEALRSSSEAVEQEITFENRNDLPEEISKDIIRLLKGSGGKSQ